MTWIKDSPLGLWLGVLSHTTKLSDLGFDHDMEFGKDPLKMIACGGRHAAH